MFPKIGDGSVKEAVIINSSGGIAGGDRLEIEVVALNNASVAVTTQAAEKIYRALDRPARIATKLKACGTAKLAWLPQETIVFNQARIRRQTEIDLCSGAELMALEWLVLGRAAHGEEVVGGHISDSWRIKRDGHLIWADGFRVSDEVFAQLHRRGTALELEGRWDADLFRTWSRCTAEDFARDSGFARLPLRRYDRWARSSLCASPQRQAADLRRGASQLARTIQSGARAGPFRSTEDVVVLATRYGRRRP